MKWTISAALLLALSAGALSGQQKQRFGDNTKPVDPAAYALVVHVTHAYVAGGLSALHLDTVIGGKKIQLESQGGLVATLHVGDYKARLVKDQEKPSGFFASSYELLFADGSHLFFNVVGESE